jgi:hypothetical protein
MDDTTALDLLENIFDNCPNNFYHNSWIEDADDACVIAEGYLAHCPTPINRDCHSYSEKEVFVEQLQQQIKIAAYLQVVYQHYLEQTQLHIEAENEALVFKPTPNKNSQKNK